MMDDILPPAQTPTPTNDNDSSLFSELLESVSPIERELIRHYGVQYMGSGRFRRLWTPEEELLANVLGKVI
jgi:hypothetical protein